MTQSKRNPEHYKRSKEQLKNAIAARIASVTKSFPERFWKRVKKGPAKDCWEWTAFRHKKGYGMLYRGRRIMAHRVSWELSKGPIPEGLFVCHHCDNPPCCNPNHLFLGTHLDNARDMRSKNRHASPALGKYGSDSCHAKLTEKQAREILARHKTGTITCVKLGKEYGVHKTTIQHLVNRKSWPNLGP